MKTGKSVYLSLDVWSFIEKAEDGNNISDKLENLIRGMMK